MGSRVPDSETLRFLGKGFNPEPYLVHGWDRIKNVHFYSLLGSSTHKKCKMLPNYDKDI